MHKLILQLRSILPVAPQAALTRLMRVLACGVIPAGIAVISLVALVAWHDQYTFSGNLPLDLRVAVQDAGTATPIAALAALRTQPPVSAFSTHLAETPFWFSIDTVHRAGGPEVIEFPSRHMVDIACWDTAGMTLLGAASRNRGDGADVQALVPAKSGFALRQNYLPTQLLCRASFIGPARLSAVQWPAEQFDLSIARYHRKSGLLDGGMIVLALCVLIGAAVYRQVLYVVFAGWLILNLRVGAMSAGWDVQWLGQLVPSSWLVPSRGVTVALFGIVTITLYQMLLGDYLGSLRHRLALRYVQWMCLPTLAATLILPNHVLVPILWAVLLTGVAALAADLVRIIFSARNSVALYFAAALVLSVTAGVAEIIAAAFDLRALSGALDSVTMALASSLLATMAVVEQMHIEQGRRTGCQQALWRTWNGAPAALLTLDGDGCFVAGNPALAAMLEVEVVAGARWQQFFTGDAWHRLHQLLSTAPHAELEIVQPASARRFMLRAALFHGRIEGVLEDVTERSREIDQLRRQVHRDPLTGTLNRRGMDDAFEAAAGALAAGRPMALAFVDFDRFKLVNDVFGRAAGDEALRQACERITGVLAAGQQLCRIDGATVLVVMPDTTMQVAELIGRGIVERVGSTPYLVGDKAFRVRASLGLVEVVQGMPMQDAIDRADRACREAKSVGGDCVVAHGGDAVALAAHAAEVKLLTRLASPNATEGMFLEMLPVMALAAPHGAQSFDAVVSMRDAGGNSVDARQIVAAAEKSGRTGVIDRWVLATTLDWIARHAGELPAPQYVCMKLSGAALNDEYFVQHLLASLRNSASLAPRLCLAIPERVALRDIDNTRRFIERVRVFGVKIALDEFGAGSSPAAYLKALPADVIKIDGALISNIMQPANAAIVESIVRMAGNLGMQTIAAGAHDGAMERALARAGVDYVRGTTAAPGKPQPQLAPSMAERVTPSA
jgi:diguanylate cyclase (GGDEF)-like protein